MITLVLVAIGLTFLSCVVAAGVNDGVGRLTRKVERLEHHERLARAHLDRDNRRVARLEAEVLSDPREWVHEAERAFDREHAPGPLHTARRTGVVTSYADNVFAQGYATGPPAPPQPDPGEKERR